MSQTCSSADVDDLEGCQTLSSPPISPELLTSYPVTPKMNRASFNEPAAITPLEPAIA